MTATVLFHNLPPEITEQELKEFFKERGNEDVEEIEFNREGSPDKVTAVVKMDMDETTARVMADRARSRMWHGRKVTVEVLMSTPGAK